MVSAEAQEIRGISAFWQISLIAIDSPEVVGPTMATTPSSSMSCLAKEIAFSVLAPESLTMSWTCLPRMPAALVHVVDEHPRRLLLRGA